MFAILLLNALFATTFIIGKAILQYGKPIFFIGFRMITAGLILLGYQYFSGLSLKIKKADIKFFVLLALVHIYIPYVFEFWALQYVSAAKTSMLFNLSPFVAAGFSFLLFKEKLTFRKFSGLLIGLMGFIPILISQTSREAAMGEFLFFSVPEIALIFAVISSAAAWIIIKKLMAEKKYSLISINSNAMLLGGLISLVTSFFFENWNLSPIYDTKNFLLLTGLIIIIGNIICYNMYGMLLKKYSGTFLSFAGFTIPLFTALFQKLIFNECVSPAFYITFITVSLGLYIFYKEELKRYS